MFNDSKIIGLTSQFDDMKKDERTNSQYEGRLRTGDFNIDGYPDIFLTMKLEDKDTKNVRTESLVLVNMLYQKPLSKELDKGWPEVPFASVEKSNKHMDTFILNKILNFD